MLPCFCQKWFVRLLPVCHGQIGLPNFQRKKIDKEKDNEREIKKVRVREGEREGGSERDRGGEREKKGKKRRRVRVGN